MMTTSGVKTFLKSHGDWVEVVSGSGKVYYYNKRSLVNQWHKPAEWLAEEERLDPSMRPLYWAGGPSRGGPLPREPSDPLKDNMLRLNLNLNRKNNVRRPVIKNPEEHLPVAYQKNGKRKLDLSSNNDEKKAKLKIENGFEDPNVSKLDQKPLAKLDPQDKMGILRPEFVLKTKTPTAQRRYCHQGRPPHGHMHSKAIAVLMF